MATDDDDDRKGKDSKEISKQSKGKQRQMHRPFEWRIVSLLAVLPVLCYVMGRRRLSLIGTVVQVSVKQPPAAHAVEQELGTRASGGGDSWWAGRPHHCLCNGSSLAQLDPLPRALTGALDDPVDELELAWLDHRTCEC